jgi:hypothetical protein
MKFLNGIVIAMLMSAELSAMDSNQCGTIGKNPVRGDGIVTYNRITMSGKRIVVSRQEKDGEEYFRGSADDIFGRRQPKQLSYNRTRTKWYKLRDECEGLIKMNEDVKNLMKNSRGKAQEK